MALSCSDVQVGLVSAERASYVVLDDGTYAQRIIEVEGGTDLGCENIVSSDTLRFGSLVQYEPGKWAKQVIGSGGGGGNMSNVLVEGAGTSDVNGLYILDDDAPTGALVSDPGFHVYAMGDYVIVHDARWQLYSISNDGTLYEAGIDATMPWLPSSWVETDGDAPPPTVTEDA